MSNKANKNTFFKKKIKVIPFALAFNGMTGRRR
jgi:hypothetical protein